MGLREMLNNGKIVRRKARLLLDIELDNGESREKGEVVYVVLDKGNGRYQVEYNEFACTVESHEIEFI